MTYISSEFRQISLIAFIPNMHRPGRRKEIVDHFTFEQRKYDRVFTFHWNHIWFDWIALMQSIVIALDNNTLAQSTEPCHDWATRVARDHNHPLRLYTIHLIDDGENNLFTRHNQKNQINAHIRVYIITIPRLSEIRKAEKTSVARA